LGNLKNREKITLDDNIQKYMSLNNKARELTIDERSKIADIVRENLSDLKIKKYNCMNCSAESTNDIIDIYNITEIKKLNIMLNLFEQYGREFHQYLPIPSLDQRALDIQLFNTTRSSSVVLKKITA
jgi:hypothetical protein